MFNVPPNYVCPWCHEVDCICASLCDHCNKPIEGRIYDLGRWSVCENCYRDAQAYAADIAREQIQENYL